MVSCDCFPRLEVGSSAAVAFLLTFLPGGSLLLLAALLFVFSAPIARRLAPAESAGPAETVLHVRAASGDCVCGGRHLDSGMGASERWPGSGGIGLLVQDWARREAPFKPPTFVRVGLIHWTHRATRGRPGVAAQPEGIQECLELASDGRHLTDSVLQFAAVEHLFAVIRITDFLAGLQPIGIGPRAIDLVINAFAGLLVSQILDERRAQRLEGRAGRLSSPWLGRAFRLRRHAGRSIFIVSPLTAVAMALACSSKPCTESFGGGWSGWSDSVQDGFHRRHQRRVVRGAEGGVAQEGGCRRRG